MESKPQTSSDPGQLAQVSVSALRDSARKLGQLKGRQVDAAALQEVRALIGAAGPDGGHRRDLLIEFLHLLNDRYRCLFERHLLALAHEMRLGVAQVFEVASFYHHFEVLTDDQVPARVTVRVCTGLGCALAGAGELLRSVQAGLAADARVVAAPCLGRCEQAPAAMVGQRALPRADAPALIAAAGADAAGAPLTSRVPDFVAYQDYRDSGGYRVAAGLASGSIDSESVIAACEQAQLRGLGGAGFAAARKWRILRSQGMPRLMAVNIDEGEPGTFKDRTYLERDPHRFLEGMLIAARITGAQACYIYLRDEYHDCRALLHGELSLLQADPPCELPRIELRRGAGAYICGEESAMLESIEGRRGEPRKRPPYIAEVGLFGRPTLEHNFETLYWVRDIVEKGAAWFAGFGRHGRSGLRSFSVSGRVRRPGVKLAPAGITLQELIDEYCGGMAEGHKLYGYLPGGASGGILPAHLNQIPLDFDTLQPYGCFIGSAAIIVLGQQDRARDAALNMMRFFAHESCGQCTPCRVGTAKAAALLQAPVWDNATLEDLNRVMEDASICGLGQAAPNPVRSVQKYFAHEIR